MASVSVLLADDQILFVENLKSVLEMRAEDIEIVGVALNGQDAVAQAERHRPDVVLMDVRMPVMDGVEATRLIREKCPETSVIMLTTYDDDQYVNGALANGAVGYLLKDIHPEQLIAVVKAVKEEGVFLVSPTVVERLVDRQGDAQPAWLSALSKRELGILRLLAQGYDNKEIADRLFLAEQTVKNHVSLIYEKIGARDRAQAMRMAIDAHIDQEKDAE
jgi:DNA-binding NarL/FixJ family response regulator